MNMNYCCYGCGQEGVVPFTSFYQRGKYRCATSANSCPAKKAALCATSAERVKHIDFTALQVKRKKTLAALDENGVSGFTRNALAVAAARRNEDGTFTGAEKTKRTKRTTLDAQGRDIFDLTAIKTATTRFGVCASLEGMPEFEKYRRSVMKITNQQPLQLLKNIEKRAAYGRSDDPYQLDHRFSVVQGFLQRIAPEIIGNIANLEMLPSVKNNSKGSSCSISLQELLSAFAENQR
jgi:hypothetical protein